MVLDAFLAGIVCGAVGVNLLVTVVSIVKSHPRVDNRVLDNRSPR